MASGFFTIEQWKPIKRGGVDSPAALARGAEVFVVTRGDGR
jgi:hypothetical protein